MTLDQSIPSATTTLPISRFNQFCHVVALVWIGAALFISLKLNPNEYPGSDTPEMHDFSQFYMGGLIARHKAWDSLYPIPKADSLNSPGAWEYSDTRPGYRALADQAGVPEKSSRYIQPPPFALMLEPVAFLKYSHAKKAWKLIMVLCAWGVAMMAGRSYEIAIGRRSPLAGVIALVVAISPLTLGTLQLMNVSPFIALMTGFAILGLVCKHSEVGAVALVVGAAAKYATAPLLPLYIAMRKWRSILVMAITTIAILAGSIAIMGKGPFETFRKEMLPTFGRTYTAEYNHSLFSLLTQIANPPGDFSPLHGLWLVAGRAAQWGSLAILLAVLFTRKTESWREPVNVMAGAASLLTWFLIFSPILWDHYFFYIVPLWGWLIWEARRSIFRALLVSGVLVVQCLPESIKEHQLPARFTIHGNRLTVLGPHECLMLLTIVGIAAVAMMRLLAPYLREADSTPAEGTFSFTRAQFNRTCAVIAALWLLIATPVSLRKWSLREGDFPQFYMGGVMAKLHAWDSLYPIPNPASHDNAGMPTDSTMRPRYAVEAERRGVGDRLRFIQPPPVALLLIPLGYLSYHRAFELWTLLLVFSAWLVALLAGRVYAILRGRETKVTGVLILLVACSPLMLHAIRVANMTVFVALLTGWATVGLVKKCDSIGGLSIMLGTVTKYATLALLPLALIMRRWKLFAITLLTGAGLLAATVGLMKTDPFNVYFRQIAPTLSRTHHIESNQSITAFLERVTGRDELQASVRWAVLAAEAVVLAALLWVLINKPVRYWDHPANVFAAAMALLTFLLMFSPVFWEHYPVYLCPLWGWLIWESRQSWVMAIGTTVSVALTYVPFTALIDNLREPYNTHILPSAIIMFLLAVWKLSHNPAVISTPVLPEIAKEANEPTLAP